MDTPDQPQPEEAQSEEASTGAALAAELLEQREAEPTLTDPWTAAGFGSLTGSNERQSSAPSVPALLAPAEAPKTTPKPEAKDGSEEKPAWEIKAERKEAITEAHFTISIDRDKIASILADNPQLLVKKVDIFGNQEEADAEYEERRADLQRTLDAISNLPENLDFKPGITLIVGENGLGKSTLARTLQLAVKVAQYMDDDGQSREKATESVLKIASSGGSAEPMLGGLAPYLLEHFSVRELQSYGHHKYMDASVLIGAHDKRKQGQPSSDLSEGKSHRQYVDWGMFGYLQDDKRRFDADTAKGSRRSQGPQVYFLDEPEAGLSPKRHTKIAEQILDSTIDNSIEIVPTNSTVLYFSDLPRIDLEHPERGIFKPSDFPDDEA